MRTLAALLVRVDDVVRLDGQERIVDNVTSQLGTSSTPYVLLSFKDGGSPLRVHAGACLEIERET